MKIYGEEKPTQEFILEHSGVKGMKWGHRKKITRTDIKTARRNQSVRRNEIGAAREKFKTTGSAADGKKLDAAVKKFKSSDDRSVAARLTLGETAATLLVGGPLGIVALAGHGVVVRGIDKDVQKNKN